MEPKMYMQRLKEQNIIIGKVIWRNYLPEQSLKGNDEHGLVERMGSWGGF